MKRVFALSAAALSLSITLVGCTGVQQGTLPEEKVVVSDSDSGTAPGEVSTPSDIREDGERFSSSIILEGMEEPVECEHIVSGAAGIAMDYHCADFVRRTGEGSEMFIWGYDDVSAPVNYMKLSYFSGSAEECAEKVQEEISTDWEEVVRTTGDIGKYYGCIALECRGSDSECVIYFIPAADGCRSVELHYRKECAEGVGARMQAMAESLEVCPIAATPE